MDLEINILPLALLAPSRTATLPLPTPSTVQDLEGRIRCLAERAAGKEQLFHPADWFNRDINDRIGFRGSDRRPNGTDVEPELMLWPDEDEPDVIPVDWLVAERQASALKMRRQEAA